VAFFLQHTSKQENSKRIVDSPFTVLMFEIYVAGTWKFLSAELRRKRRRVK
jgi:hypothetical protein